MMDTTVDCSETSIYLSSRLLGFSF